MNISYLFVHLYLYFSTLTYIISSNIISQDIKYDYNIPHVFSIVESKRKSSIYRPLNTMLQFTWFVKWDLPDIPPSKQKGEQSIELIDLCYGYQYEDDIYFNNITKLPNFNFFVFDSARFYHRDSGIGLAYRFNNYSFSIVHELYRNEIIDKKQFVFEMRNNNATIHYGGVPYDKHLNYPYKGYCNVVESRTTWGCMLTGIYYKGKREKYNNYTIFHSACLEMIISNKFYDTMKNIVLKDLIQKNICSSSEDKSRRSNIKCNYSDTDLFDRTIEIEFDGNMKIQIPVIKLFDISTNTSAVSLFYREGFSEDNDNIIVGFPFMRLFSFMVFDYDNSTIDFYSFSYQIDKDINTSSIDTIKGILYIIILLSIINCIYLIIIRNK